MISFQAEGRRVAARENQTMAQAGTQVQLSQVSLTYRGENDSVVALDDVSLFVAPGEAVAIIGPSGCGKSSTLHMLAGILKPTSGSVSIGGSPVDEPRRTTAFIPQGLGVLPWKTVAQNAALGLTIQKAGARESRERALEALREVDLVDFADAFPKELSGGMRQRLALARAIAMDADLLLMDEPLSAVDALLRESLQDMLLDLWKRRSQTQILVTHSIDEAVFLGQRIFVMTSRPGTVAAVVENSSMGEQGFRDSDAFAKTCVKVRAALFGDNGKGVRR